MKKTLLAIGALALLAASCNMNLSRPNTQTPAQKSAASVDAAIDDLTAGIESEEKINFETDDDVVNSDKQVITNYEGVSNASY